MDVKNINKDIIDPKVNLRNVDNLQVIQKKPIEVCTTCMRNYDLAPIVLFVYNRPVHTSKTLNSLLANDLADQSHLYIYSDGPKPDAPEEELRKIHDVRRLIREKQWCKEITIFESEGNKGLARSIIDGISETVNKFGKIIVLEDDIVTAKGFLKFMNEGLKLYESDERVFGVSGYYYPSKLKLPSSYFLPIGGSWGWATWKSAWQHFEPDTHNLLDRIKNEDLISKFDFGSYPFYKMLADQRQHRIDSWAINFYASFFLKKGLFLFPGASLIKNIGFDNTGRHCKEDAFYNKIESVNYISIKNEKVELNSKCVEPVKKSFNEHFKKKTFIQRLYNKIANLI